jgi:hypothetical protein
MAITKEECEEIQRNVNTIGGETYYIRKHGEVEFTALCFRPKYGEGYSDVVDETGRLLRCSQPAGHGTDHKGSGACSMHGAPTEFVEASIARNIKHGRGAIKTRKRLAGSIDEYLNGDKTKLMDLSYELAATRAIFKEFIDVFPDPQDDNFGLELQRVTNLVGTIGTLVDKISRIESRNALTMSQLLYFRAVIADILAKYIENPSQLEMAGKELVQRVGGNKEYAIIKQD